MKKIISIIIIFIMLFNIIYYIYIPSESLAALSANYTQTTDDEGYASLLINLPPRNANCTVSFKENYYVNGF